MLLPLGSDGDKRWLAAPAAAVFFICLPLLPPITAIWPSFPTVLFYCPALVLIKGRSVCLLPRNGGGYSHAGECAAEIREPHGA